MIELIGGYAPPTPSESTETDLRRFLKDIDPLLDVKWIPTVYWNQRHRHWEGRYAIMVNWPTADKRWSMVQSGEVDPAQANDIVGWICKDMTDPQTMPTSLEGVEERVMEALGKMDNTRYPWKQRLLSCVEKNKKVHTDMKKEALDMVHDEADYRFQEVTNAAFGRGANFDSTGKIVK